MALTDDQRAMLRLLAQREEGYEDIAALMGLSVEDVRARVRGALAELNETGATPSPPPPPPPAPSTHPVESATPPPAPPPPRPRSLPKPKLKLPSDRRRLAEIVGAALVALLVVLFAVGVIDIGGGEDSGSGSGDETAAGTGVAAGAGQEPTQARLSGVGGSEARGEAIFGRVGKNVVLAFAATGLEPTPQGRSYAISLIESPRNRIPIAAAEVDSSGNVAQQYPVATNVLGLLANGYERMEVSLVVNRELRAALQQAQSAEETPTFSGEAVLRGPVTGPIVEFEGK